MEDRDGRLSEIKEYVTKYSQWCKATVWTFVPLTYLLVGIHWLVWFHNSHTQVLPDAAQHLFLWQQFNGGWIVGMLQFQALFALEREQLRKDLELILEGQHVEPKQQWRQRLMSGLLILAPMVVVLLAGFVMLLTH